jgi:trans-2,3-dihydro-3-hydroxyanthranilate isomerase
LNLERFGGPGTDALIVLEEEVGIVRCGVTFSNSVGFAEFNCPKLPERAGKPPEREFIAAALSLAPAEIGFENHVPTTWSAGVPFHFVPVQNLAVIGKAAPYAPAWRPAFGTGSAFVYTRETQGYDHSFHARMFAPEMGIDEDPATGGAVAALAGAVHEFDALPDGEHAAIIEQGYEMGRPSLIRLEMMVGGGQLTLVRIGGHAVPIMSGTLDI